MIPHHTKPLSGKWFLAATLCVVPGVLVASAEGLPESSFSISALKHVKILVDWPL